MKRMFLVLALTAELTVSAMAQTPAREPNEVAPATDPAATASPAPSAAPTANPAATVSPAPSASSAASGSQDAGRRVATAPRPRAEQTSFFDFKRFLFGPSTRWTIVGLQY